MIRFASLGSGSKGNGTLVEGGDTRVLIDCGFSIRESERRLAKLGRSPEDLSAILTTHEHGDHLSGVLPLARKYRLPVVLTHGTARAARIQHSGVDIRLIASGEEFTLGSLRVVSVAVPHDACEPVQYIVAHGRRRVGVLTDLGSISPHVVASFNGCDGLLLEANHDERMLAEGSYPTTLKKRVGGNWGHLSNRQSASLLARLDRRKLQVLVLGHISLQNNSRTLVADMVAPYRAGIGQVEFARQDEGFAWQIVE